MKKLLLTLVSLCISAQLMAMDTKPMELTSDKNNPETFNEELDTALVALENQMFIQSIKLSKEVAALKTQFGSNALHEDPQHKAHNKSLFLRYAELTSLANPAYEWCRQLFIKAAMRGDLERVDYLLRAGIDSNETDSKNGKSALEYAATIGTVPLCKLLLEHGANDGLGAAFYAAEAMHESTCKFLITYFFHLPYTCEEKFLVIRERIFTALLVFKRLCPALPRDMRKAILWADEEIRCEAFVSGIYGDLLKENQNKIAYDLPIRAIQIFIKNNIFDTEKIVAALKSAYYEKINRSLYDISHNARVLIKSILETCGTEIEENIRIKLALLASNASTRYT